MKGTQMDWLEQQREVWARELDEEIARYEKKRRLQDPLLSTKRTLLFSLIRSRHNRKMTQADLARAIGVQQSLISRALEANLSFESGIL